ncbi:MAG TPA: SCP2 sterol-binding domain-containing protein [Gemmatimonadaceae bacterium]|nr:SCP2 sterol-binding domain-containing protein [Gemmatimonadaceae bacterium]
MSITAFSPAWADALLVAVNTDDDYRDVAGRWSNPVALVVEPGANLAAGAAVQVDLASGSCLAAESLSPAAVSAPYVLSADLASWKAILTGDTDPIAALALGRLKLTRGSTAVLMLNARAAKALLACARRIVTLWP